MWSLRKKPNGEFYLTFDHSRRYDRNFRGVWELICNQTDGQKNYYIQVNKLAGYIVCDDDNNGVRALVLE